MTAANGAARLLLIASIDAIGVARLPALFAKSGYRISVLGPPRISARRSRYVSEHVPASGDPKGVAIAAQNHVAEAAGAYDWVLFVDEPVLLAAVDHCFTGPLAPWFPFPRDAETVGTITSKIRFLQAASAAGLAVPEHRICADAGGALQSADQIGYPVIVKSSRGLAGSGLTFATSHADLGKQFAQASSNGERMVQQIIEGESGSTSVLYDHGRPLCWFSYLMQQTWPNRFSSACVAKIFDHPDIEPLVSGVGAITRFHGLAGIDWMRDRKTGRLVLLELNPRPTPTYHLGRYAGVDFSQALSGLRTGNPTVQRPTGADAEIPMFPQMLYKSVEARSPASFLQTFADAPWDEPQILLGQLRRLITHYIPIKRLFNF